MPTNTKSPAAKPTNKPVQGKRKPKDRTEKLIAQAQERDAAIAAELASQETTTVKAGAGLEAAANAQAQATKGALADPNVQAQIEAALAAKASRKGKKAQAKAVTKAVAAVAAKATPVIAVPAGTSITPTKGQPKLSKAQLAQAKAHAAKAAGIKPVKGKSPKAAIEAGLKALKHPEALAKGGCPHCGDIDNGCTENAGANKGDNVNNYLDCHMCGASFHKTTGALKPQRKAGKGSSRAGTKGGYKIEKDREAQGGITKRSAGTKGNKLWHLFEGLAQKAGGLAKLLPADAKAAAVKAGYNETTAGIAFYRYRRFSGILGRVELKKAMPKAARKAAKASQAKAPAQGKGKPQAKAQGKRKPTSKGGK